MSSLLPGRRSGVRLGGLARATTILSSSVESQELMLLLSSSLSVRLSSSVVVYFKAVVSQ